MANMDLKDYAGIGQAAAIFGMYLPDNVGRYPQLNILSADMSVAASLDRYIYQCPDQFTEIGIAEQNLVGVAAGMASEGYTSVAVAQAAFIAMRAYEMDRQYLGYMKNKVILVGLNSGFYLQYFGNTHYCIEDLAIMRNIPNMKVFSPCDAGEAVMAFDAAINCDGPAYIRLTGGAQAPTVYHDTCSFEIGKNIILRDGSDVCVFATGACVGFTMEAADILSKKYKIETKVIDVHTLKPFDEDSVRNVKDYRLIVSVEEHNVIGGLGTAIADVMAGEGGYAPLLKLGVKDVFSKPGGYGYLMAQHRLTPEMIAEDIFAKLNTL